MNYWLFKTEESVYSISDLEKSPQKTTCWEGVRNYQARNFLRDEVKKGDMVFFYHSNCDTIGIAGTAKVVKDSYPDSYALDKKSKYYDAKSTNENPRWYMVDIKLDKKFKEVIPLSRLRENASIKEMRVLKKGCRLSVTPVTAKEWSAVMKMAG